jgi:hypothetical protein
VYHFNESVQEYEYFSFHTRYIEDHIRYTMQIYPERFQKLLDSGEIYSYLDSLEVRAIETVD